MSDDSQEPQADCVGKCPLKEQLRSLIYWQNPLRSVVVLTLLLALEFSFLCLSTISLLAYTGFFMLLFVNGLRLYYHYISKNGNKMIKDFLDHEVSIPKERVTEVSLRLTDMLNRQLMVARDIFLLTDIGASIKFGIVLYLMTYVGARLNFLTLCIIATFIAFFVPKFYERYQSEIDHGLDVVRKKATEVFTQINGKLDKLPIIGSKKQKTN